MNIYLPINTTYRHFTSRKIWSGWNNCIQ